MTLDFLKAHSLDILLVAVLVIAAIWTVMTTRLMRSVIALAVTSAVLTVIMFYLEAPLAAVFELSVCAGLISAVFLGTISMTRRITPEDLPERKKARLARYWYLPVLVLLAGIALMQVYWPMDFSKVVAADVDVRHVLWNERHLDLLGQIAVLLGGAFGVVVLFKEWKHE